MAQPELPARIAEVERFVAGTIVGHHARHGDTETGVIGDSCFEECGGALLLLVGHDLDKGNARSVIDADMDEFPAEAFAARAPVALASAVSGDAVPYSVDPAELIDADME
jgi:hypothetical protein